MKKKYSPLEQNKNRIANLFNNSGLPVSIFRVESNQSAAKFTHLINLDIKKRAFHDHHFDDFAALLQYVFRTQGFMHIHKSSYLVVIDSDFAVCRECGCSEKNACEGGCHWIEFDLCSSCWNRFAQNSIEAALKERFAKEGFKIIND